ncbi:anthranilate phosphoribosyltransferase, chloroplastic [Arabidopsis lyrata subsp. lyrata]|uniref:anthranilate phosphoribosyltransferase, chloroplastic n=1 Tax=Arabidopsis lyrata subsp. lyrata TaxID=81972 RepID=UPI000A29CD2E|nr:anthranilate phosphoribosyltransferase, chloroplastic [Arabidopsis lyrata subsp. lyrata]|eukprot:XP_020884645.1 anthranilate phosphoribosyltransferase, chloroplastic [Arabidopsis lyrata subsp. lyrata]
MASSSNVDPRGASESTVLKRNSNDVAWDYGILYDLKNLDKVKCKLCGKEFSGEIWLRQNKLKQENHFFIFFPKAKITLSLSISLDLSQSTTGILTSVNAADDGSSSFGKTNLTGVRIYPTLSRRRFSSIRVVSPIRGDAQSSFSRSSFVCSQNLGLSGGISGFSAPEALPNVCENATPSSIKSFNQLIETLIDRVDLSEAEAESSLEFLLNEANEALISAFLVLLRAKGETYEEIVGLAREMMKHARKVEGLVDAVDIVGTGGDGANTVNISTGSSILAAACGAKVAKVIKD